MKYLLVLAVLLVAFWIWRQGRREAMRPPQTPRKQAQPPRDPQAMLPCAHCGVHLPAGDALPGRNGHYCCTAHRDAAESA